MARNTRVLRWLAALLCACLVFSNFGGVTTAKAVYDANSNDDVYPLNGDADAVEAFKKGELSYDPSKPTTQVDLLTGTVEDNSLRQATIGATLDRYASTYFLGIASDFCVFMRDYFKVFQSDTEGRAAIGGDLIIDTPGADNYPSYAIGEGDFVQQTPLDELLPDRVGAATAIVGGDITSDWEYSNGKGHGRLDDEYYENKQKLANKKSTKKLVITDNYKDELSTSSNPYWPEVSIPHVFGPTPGQKIDQRQTYKTDLLDFNNLYYSYLDNLSDLLVTQAKLTQAPNDTEVTVDNETTPNRITFTYKGHEAEQDCVYFTLDETTFEWFQKAKYIDFKNIPKLQTPRAVVMNSGEWTTWEYAYIVVNVAYSGKKHTDGMRYQDVIDSSRNYLYFFDPTLTSNGASKITTIYGFNDTTGINISKDGGKENNYQGVTSLLYNFHGATRNDTVIVLGTNFQGTIYAPKAHVTDGFLLEVKQNAKNEGYWQLGQNPISGEWLDDDEVRKLTGGSDPYKNYRGHLSGALVADSFEGGTEFGYRPFSALFEQIVGSGNLEIAKTVTGEGADKEQAFAFELGLTYGSSKTAIDDNTFGVEVTDSNGDAVDGAITELEFKNGVAKFTLKDGQKLTIRDLTVGWSYEVKEISVEGYEASNKATGVIGETISGTIESGKTKEAGFVNTFRKIKTGSLVVYKSVTGEGADKTKAFRFTVELSEKLNAKFGDMIFENGVASFTLKHDQKATATGLPVNITYTVTEVDADGYTSSATGEKGSIVADKTVTAQFINTKIADEKDDGKDDDAKIGNLTVSKTVTGKNASETQAFSFTVTLGDRTVTGKYGDMVFTNGVAKFSLKHGEKKSAVGLPDGVAYTVTEDSPKDYKLTQTGDKGVIMNGQTQISVFVNAYIGADGSETTDVPKTGDSFPMQLWLGLMAAALIGLCAVVRKSRRS